MRRIAALKSTPRSLSQSGWILAELVLQLCQLHKKLLQKPDGINQPFSCSQILGSTGKSSSCSSQHRLGWLEDWRLESYEDCLFSRRAANIQTAGAGKLGLLRHLSLSCIVSPAWQLQGSLASHVVAQGSKGSWPEKVRESPGSPIAFYESAWEATKCHLDLTVYTKRAAPASTQSRKR